jgi:hypothetical protein
LKEYECTPICIGRGDLGNDLDCNYSATTKWHIGQCGGVLALLYFSNVLICSDYVVPKKAKVSFKRPFILYAASLLYFWF